MSPFGKFLCWSAFVFAASVLDHTAQAGQLYRWSDAQGNIYYSDKVPPQYSKYRRSKLNEQGITVDIVEKSKTKDEFEREQKLKDLRSAQQKLLEAQLAEDRTLLRSFASDKELEASFKAKLDTLDILQSVNLANISRLEALLDAQEKRAADLERSGKKVPDFLVESILGYRQQIAITEQKIQELENQKLELRQQLATGLNQFRTLIEAKESLQFPERPSLSPNQDNQSIALSVIICPDEPVCEKTWTLARTYLMQHSSTKIRIDSDLIIHTFGPENDQDIALSLAKIQDKDSRRAQIFFDVRCKLSPLGRELCSGQKVGEILSGFPTYIQGGLK